MIKNKPFAESCEQNKQVILEQLVKLLADKKNCLELGSGTGQHAVHFAAHLPDLSWQPSDLGENIAGMKLWFDEAKLSNIAEPVELDVAEMKWPFRQSFDAAFTANTLHIMSIDHVEKLFRGLGNVLSSGATFISYGPFNYNGKFTSESNARFDVWLKQRDSVSGIRDLDDLKRFASAAGLVLDDDIEMPVNNRLLVWKRQ